MNEHLFYHKDLSESTQSLSFVDEEFHHMTRVLRLKAGDKLEIINGQGIIASGVLREIQKKNAHVNIEKINCISPPAPKLALAFAPVKKRDKNEWIIEKAIEIGVSAIYLFVSSHSERSEIKMERIDKTIIAAMKQSGELFKPEVNVLHTFDLVSDQVANYTNKFIAWCGASAADSLSHHNLNKKDTVIFIGPEGGFSSSEIETAVGKGFVPVSLGKNRLRTETAAIFSLSVLKSKSEI